MVGKTVRPTAAQKRRMDRIAKMGCVACYVMNQRQPNGVEIHHIVDMGYRHLSGGHDSTIPLCAWHHRGIPTALVGRGSSVRAMAEQHGPSLAVQKREFVRHYGNERQLLEIVNKQLESEA